MAEFEKPQSRVEAVLQNILGAENELESPQSRAEAILQSILYDTAYDETPQSDLEALLLAVKNGEGAEYSHVLGRAEAILLAKIQGEEYLGVPQSRLEELLLEWAAVPPSELPDGYKRLLGLSFDAASYFIITGFRLQGSDTVRLSFSVNKACNVFGCYTTTTADDNYSLYMSTSSGAKYMRYNGGTYKSQMTSAQFGQRFDVVLTPTGSSGMPTDDTWTEQDFTASADMCIGTTSPSATSSKLDGNLWRNFEVDGRFKGIPVERESDGVLGYYDPYSKTFYAPAAGTPTSLGYDTAS